MMETIIFKTIELNGVKSKQICTSYSQIQTWLDCPYRWKLDYLLGQRQPAVSEPLSLGTAIHETLEQYFNGVKDGKEFTLAEAQDMLDFNMDVNDIPFASEENKVIAEQQHSEMIKGLVGGTSELAKFMKDKEVVACEKDFKLCVKLPFDILFDGDRYNHIYIIGSIDFIVKDRSGGLHVVDFKSGKTLFKPKKLKENLQLKIYSLVIKEIYGRLPVSTQYYFTRMDEFQNVLPLANREEDRICEYYKNGKVKTMGSLVGEIYEQLVDIFREQYTTCSYIAKPCALCSWCGHSPLYGEQSPCKFAQKYIRKDIPIPKPKAKRIIKA